MLTCLTMMENNLIVFLQARSLNNKSAPRTCNWECAQNLGRYLQTHPDLIGVTTLDPEGPLGLDVFSDSDWGDARKCAEAQTAMWLG